MAAITNDDGRPVPPLNLIGDFGGGSLYLALGIIAALWERERSGFGQVVDAAIIDGVASLMTMFAGLLPSGSISLDPAKNILGGRAPFYRCYECADGRFISIGPLEPRFYEDLIRRAGASDELAKQSDDPSNWREQTVAFSALFKTRTRDEWCDLLEGSNACFAPVLGYDESLLHKQMRERETYVEVNGLKQAAPAPRFSRTPGRIGEGGLGADLLKRWLDTPRIL